MKNTEWKKYVKAAKLHLSQTTNAINESESYYINSKKISRKELDRMEESVREIVSSDDFISNPLGRLIDEKIFEKLSDGQKMKYILDLSKIYLLLRTKAEKRA